MKKLDQIDIEQIVRKHDPFLRVAQKKGWKKQKKLKYIDAMIDHFTKKYPPLKVYECFVKKGQVYTLDQGYVDQQGVIHQVDERPRAIQNSL